MVSRCLPELPLLPSSMDCTSTDGAHNYIFSNLCMLAMFGYTRMVPSWNKDTFEAIRQSGQLLELSLVPRLHAQEPGNEAS